MLKYERKKKRRRKRRTKESKGTRTKKAKKNLNRILCLVYVILYFLLLSRIYYVLTIEISTIINFIQRVYYIFSFCFFFLFPPLLSAVSPINKKKHRKNSRAWQFACMHVYVRTFVYWKWYFFYGENEIQTETKIKKQKKKKKNRTERRMRGE